MCAALVIFSFYVAAFVALLRHYAAIYRCTSRFNTCSPLPVSEIEWRLGVLCIATYAMYSGVVAENGDESGNRGKVGLYWAEANTKNWRQYSPAVRKHE